MATEPESKTPKGVDESKAWFIAAYVIPYMISGIIVLFLKGEEDKRLKFHAMQSIFLGILMIVVSIVFDILSLGIFLIGTLGIILIVFLWLYGLYIGFEAYNGKDIAMPMITDYARRYSGYGKSK
ncbi:MAG: DUF4870 domain-containing protein [Candidatus Micrarchaeaceae archaeon]